MLRAAFVAMRQALCLFLLAPVDQVAQLTAAQECPEEADFDFSSSVPLAYDGGECGHFCRAYNWCIDRHNIAEYNDKTLTECACACQSNSACVSFDWRDGTGYNCALQFARSSEVSHGTTCIDIGWSYFEKLTMTAGTCFSDDFSSIDSGWISVEGDWSWSGGTVDNNVGNYDEGNVLYIDADYSDGYLEASVSVSSGEEAGLLFRITDMPAAANYFNDAGQMYYCGIARINYSQMVICGRMNNNWSELFTYYTTIAQGQFYDLGINMDGSDFTVFLDGAEIGSFSDSSYSSGGVGLRTYQGRGVYDSISYEAPECTTTTTTTTGTGYIFQAGRCYPESGAPLINTGGGMANDVSDDFRETASPQLCYNYCAANTMGNNYMGLDLRSTGGQDCVCKPAQDDYNDDRWGMCKRPAVTSVAIEDMDWSWMTEDYVCFTEDFDADAELSELCDEGESDADGGGGDDKDSDDNSLALILGVVGAVVVVGIAIMIVVMKRRKPAKPPSEAAPPVAAVVHEPTSPPPPPLAPIKAMALEMMAEETAEFAPEAASLPPGYVSGAEAAAMAQPSEGWGRRFASWRAVGEPPPPPQAEFEPEC